MSDGPSRPAVGSSSFKPPVGFRDRAAALVEVLLAFVFVHLSFRAIKQFTALGRLDATSGLNFTPGLVMILFSVGVLLVCHRDFSAYGLTLARAGEGLKLGLLWGLLLIGGGALLRLLQVRYMAGGAPPGMREGIAYGMGCVIGVFVFVWLAKRQRLVLSRVPMGGAVVLLVGVLLLPLLVAWRYERPLVHTLLAVAWLVIGAGVGEELFYRGYIQSRINEAFGRPFSLWGIQFGAGLVVSSLLFGFLHTLNSVDYFHGRFTFAWGFGVATVGVGLIFGCLRESTGSVVAGIVAHSVLDVLARIPTLIS